MTIVRASLKLALFALVALGPFVPAPGGFVDAPFGVRAVRAADKAKPAGKFKVGDTVEVKDGGEWVRGTVMDFTIGDRIRVKSEKFKEGLPFAADEVRAVAKAKGEDDESDPFATPEEKVQKVGKRTWNDRSGKFKIEATILRFDEDKVVLKRTDGKEVTVPIERLSPEDQKIIAQAGGPTVGGGAGDGQPGASGKSAAAAGPKSDLTETTLSDAPSIDVTHTSNWSYVPDAETSERSPRAGRMPLGQRLENGEHPSSVLVSAAKNTAFVIFKPMDKRKDSAQPGSRIVACDLAKRKVLAAGEFHSEQLPLDLSEDGSRLLAREAKQPFNKGTAVYLYEMDGFKATPKLGWRPYADGKDVKEVNWTAFVDTTHALTMSDGGVLVLWDLRKGVQPVYRASSDVFGGSNVAFSANKKYVAFCERGGVVILEPLTGKVAGHLEMGDLGHRPVLAFRDDGKKLLVVTGARIRVWDLGRQELYRDFSVERMHSNVDFAWADEDRVISSRGDLVDVERRLLLWRYQGVNEATELVGGSVWTVSENGRDGQWLTGARVPHEAARSRVASIKANDLVLIKPGMEVSLEMQFVGTPDDQQSVERALLKRLTDNGMKVVPSSSLKLVAQIKPGKAMTVAYRAFGARTETQHSAMSQVMELSYVKDGQPIWTHKGETSPPHRLQMARGQTIDQALSDHMRLDPKALGSVFIPPHVTKPLGDENSRTSPLPGA